LKMYFLLVGVEYDRSSRASRAHRLSSREIEPKFFVGVLRVPADLVDFLAADGDKGGLRIGFDDRMFEVEVGNFSRVRGGQRERAVVLVRDVVSRQRTGSLQFFPVPRHSSIAAA